MNRDAKSDADGGLLRHPGRGWGWMDDHPLLRAGAEREAPAGP